LDKDQLFLIWNKGGNPKGKSLQLCSQWLQDTLGNENWRNFPLARGDILKIAAPIGWSDAGRKSNPSARASSSQNSPAPGLWLTGSRSRSCSPSLERSFQPSKSPNRMEMRPLEDVIIHVSVSTFLCLDN
jgi:hypothetical protein